MPEEAARLVVPITAWLVLGAVVALGLVVDLFGHRGDRGRGRKSAALWSAAWIATALLFGLWVAFRFGRDAAEDYFSAFLLEKSLSVDNLFVFLLVFGRLRIPDTEQHRVLRWGIWGAFVTRGIFIAGGSALLSAWHGVVYILGAFLILTGIKTARDQGESAKGEGKLLPFLRRHLPFTPELRGRDFIAVEHGRRVATPLLLALLVIEITDVLFAVDSIPAVFAITKEPFLVYSSNIFALLGLRALYGVLADLLADLRYLRYGLGAILVFAGAKMLTGDVLHIPRSLSLLIIAGILTAVVVPSIISRARASGRSAPAPP